MNDGAKLAALAFAAAAALASWLALSDLDVPGLYYDEVIQAVPAAEFLRGGERPFEIPGAKSLRVAGRWLPLRTQPYMGALKSQLLIPVFAAFGTSGRVLRATTFAWGLVGALLAVLLARRLLDPPIACVAGALLVLDPAFLFTSRHDWGSFALGLACRCGGLGLALAGLERRSRLALGAAGLVLGLGVYNKIDQVPLLAAVAVAAVLAAPRAAVELARRRPSALAALAAGLAVGASPLAIGGARLGRGVASALGDGGRLGGEAAAKLWLWRSVFDGSYFERLWLGGGSFEPSPHLDVATGFLLPALVASALWLALRLARSRPWGREERARAFALGSLVLGGAALALVPHALRIHHALNLAPFPQLVVAAACVDLLRSPRLAARALAAAVLAAVLAGHVHVDLRTRAEIDASGGRGRWSDALAGYARELASEPGVRVVSLDWGFHAPLRFLAPQLDLSEPIWSLGRSARAGPGLEGDAHTVYLVQDPRWRVFDLGDELLADVDRLPAGAAVVERHRDRLGDTAFLSVRIAGPHRLVYRDRLEVELE